MAFGDFREFRGADAEEVVAVKGWMHMLKNVNNSLMNDA